MIHLNFCTKVLRMNFENLLKLSKVKRWDEFELIILENRTEEFERNEYSGSHNLLYSVCYHQLPLFVVQATINKTLEFFLQIDYSIRLLLRMEISN